MPERNGAAVRVDLCAVDLGEVVQHGEDHGCECLVDLEKRDIVEGKSLACKQFADGVDRCRGEVIGLGRDHSRAEDDAEGLEVKLGRTRLRGDEGRYCAVIERRRVACGDRAVLREGRLQC